MYLYIDPGTGNMLFTIVISIIGFLFCVFRILLVKVKFLISRGKVRNTNEEQIPILMFAETKRYWMVFKPICAELNRRNVRFVNWTIADDNPVFEETR